MPRRKLFFRIALSLIAVFSGLLPSYSATTSTDRNNTLEKPKKYLYVAVPGIRNYLGYGGHGILIFDIDEGHRFVKRIATQGFSSNGKPSNVKGIDVSIPLNSLFISTLEGVQRLDLKTEKIVWEIAYEGGADRMSISPDGLTMYLPSLEKDFWNVVSCETGEVITTIKVYDRAHNTIYGPSGDFAYLADISSPFLHVADTRTHTITKKIGPFSHGIRPFTINSEESLVYVNVNELLGFEVGDLNTGEVKATVKVEGWDKGPVRRHGNPSHGIGLTPDEKEIWISDGHNMRMHVFQAFPPYQQLTTIPLQDMPGWVTFSLDGKYAYPSSGEVIDVTTRKTLHLLQDEHHNYVASEKMIELHIEDGRVIAAGDQFGIGRKNQ